MEALLDPPSTNFVEYSNFSFDGNTTELAKLSHSLSLQEVEFAFFINTNLPAFCLMLILCVVGTIGNIHTILVYTLVKEMKKRSACTLIVWLSSVDLIVSIVCMPFEVYDLHRSFSLTNEVACKLIRYLAHALVLMSGILLVTLARQRYQKCYKMVPGYKSRLACISRLNCARQLKAHSANFQYNCTCLIILVIAFSFTSPFLLALGIEKFDHLGISGTKCFVLDQYRSKMHAGIYGGLFALLGLICVSICCHSYGRIILLMYRQSKHKIRCNKQTDTNLTTNPTEAHIEEKIGSYDINKQNQTPKAQDRFKKGIRLTWSLIVASFLSWIGFILFVIGAAIRVSDPEFERSIRMLTAVLIRAQFINIAVNPVAYSLVDPKFRSAAKKLYMRLYASVPSI